MQTEIRTAAGDLVSREGVSITMSMDGNATSTGLCPGDRLYVNGRLVWVEEDHAGFARSIVRCAVIGVPLSVLCCPTCREPFHREMRRDAEPTGQTSDLMLAVALPTMPLYMVCWSGHAWTVDTISRPHDGAGSDRIKLGRYLGVRDIPSP